MKKVWILTCTLTFISVVGFARTPRVGPFPSEILAAILSPPAAAGSASCPTSQGKVLLAVTEGGGESTNSICNATANCESGTVYCEGNSTCSAADRSCPEEQGHVTCDGVTTWCPTACPCNIQCQRCNTCAQTGDCFSCCRCEGGTLFQCSQACP
jgi:hypothetical protein